MSFNYQKIYDVMEESRQKVIVILGATGSGKTKLSVDIASRLGAEIINTDKIQAYRSFHIVTNKVTKDESNGIHHHLIGELDDDDDYPVHDFCSRTLSSIYSISHFGSIPILVGGSNNYISTLLDNPLYAFRRRYQPCFIWLDMATNLLHRRLSTRVDMMLKSGALNEIRGMFKEGADYTRGVRRAIGVQEMEAYILSEREGADKTTQDLLLQKAVEDMKFNTIKLADRQVDKIRRLKGERGWEIHRINTTPVFDSRDGDGEDNTWEKHVMKPCHDILTTFFREEESVMSFSAISSIAIPTPALTPLSI